MTGSAIGTFVLQSGSDTAGIVSAVFIFLISLLVGAVAIRVGAQLFVDIDTGYRRAIVTALLGAIVYTLVGFFVGWIPLLGPFLMLLVWVGVVNWQYPGGWATAAGIGLIAWISAVLILLGLSTVGIVTPDALGVPGV